MTGWGSGAGQIWRSADGVTWSQVAANGLGNSNNAAMTVMT